LTCPPKTDPFAVLGFGPKSGSPWPQSSQSAYAPTASIIQDWRNGANKRKRTFGLIYAQTAILLAPAIISLLGYPYLFTNLGDWTPLR
jgi:hypothetical protein